MGPPLTRILRAEGCAPEARTALLTSLRPGLPERDFRAACHLPSPLVTWSLLPVCSVPAWPALGRGHCLGRPWAGASLLLPQQGSKRTDPLGRAPGGGVRHRGHPHGTLGRLGRSRTARCCGRARTLALRLSRSHFCTRLCPLGSCPPGVRVPGLWTHCQWPEAGGAGHSHTARGSQRGVGVKPLPGPWGPRHRLQARSLRLQMGPCGRV